MCREDAFLKVKSLLERKEENYTIQSHVEGKPPRISKGYFFNTIPTFRRIK